MARERKLKLHWSVKLVAMARRNFWLKHKRAADWQDMTAIAIRLVRQRDAYQRARFRKIVKKELLKTWQGDHTTAKAMNIAHRSACNCILVALLKGRAR